jgi:hypothetical protein
MEALGSRDKQRDTRPGKTYTRIAACEEEPQMYYSYPKCRKYITDEEESKIVFKVIFDNSCFLF